MTAAAYEGFVRDPAYLERIADVADRAPRTIVLVAIEDGRIVGSRPSSSPGGSTQTRSPSAPAERTSGCSASRPTVGPGMARP